MRRFLVVLATGALLAGCGGETGSAMQESARTTSQAPSPTQSSAPAETSAADARKGRLVTTADSQFGEMLFDSTGQAIYLFDKEKTARPECYDDCAVAWPPMLTKGAPRAAGGVKSALLGTTPRDDGSTQVTYDDHPLYYYAHEGKNEVLCHNVTGFGGLWLVVTPSGEPAD